MACRRQRTRLSGCSALHRTMVVVGVLSLLPACDGTAARDASRPTVPSAGAPAPVEGPKRRGRASARMADAAASATTAAAPQGGVEDAGDGLPPLEAAGPTVELAVEGFGPAVAAVPVGARSKRPVLIATHGNYDRPEWQCYEWWKLLQDRAFVLCPRGMARSDSPSKDDVRFRYAHNRKLEQEIDAALRALRQRFGKHVDEQAMVYTGFSQGAIMGVAIAARLAERFPRLVLVEGGHDRWTAATATRFAEGGGQRVLFACGQKGCELAARRVSRHLEKVGVATRVVHAAGQGHSYGGPMHLAIGAELDWLLEGDQRWGWGSVDRRP